MSALRNGCRCFLEAVVLLSLALVATLFTSIGIYLSMTQSAV